MSSLHLMFLHSISRLTQMSLENIAFHGGTNLHLSWNSPRFSEDLDFLVSKDFAGKIDAAMSRIEKDMNRIIAPRHPGTRIEILDRTRDRTRMLVHRIAMTRGGVIGKAMVKVVFWQVEPEYLKAYGSRFLRQRDHDQEPDPIVRLSMPVPAADLDAAFADKVVALGLRERLKWRDLFDLWWLKSQIETDPELHVGAVRHHASGYGDISLTDGFRRFLDREPDGALASADPDLKRWLPERVWDSLWPDEVRNMVEHARTVAERFMESLEGHPENDETRERGDDEDPGL